MAALPYIQLYIAEYLADTAHLNAAQHGAYLLLIFNYWQRGKPLKNSNERLANVARMSNEEWLANRDVLAEFFEVTDEEWSHSRIEADLSKVMNKSDRARAAGRASAQQRLNGRSTDVQRTFNGRSTDVQRYRDTDKDKDKDIIPPVTLTSDIPQGEVLVSQEPLPEGLFEDEIPEEVFLPSPNQEPKKKRKVYEVGFEKFWAAYPHRVSKGPAEKAWNRIRPDEKLLQEMLSAIALAKESKKWKKDRGKFIPYPATWLNAKGWLDEIPDKKGYLNSTVKDKYAYLNKTNKYVEEV